MNFHEAERYAAYETVWIGYTSYNKKRVKTANFGIWIGYKQGNPYKVIRFRQTVPKEKFGQNVWTHVKSLVVLFDNIHWEITSPPLVLISSKKALNFLLKQKYKWASISHKEKAKIHFWLDTLNPKLESYNVLEQPFCLLRELMLEESEFVSKKLVQKELVNLNTCDIISLEPTSRPELII